MRNIILMDQAGSGGNWQGPQPPLTLPLADPVVACRRSHYCESSLYNHVNLRYCIDWNDKIGTSARRYNESTLRI